jgi:GT2 family glycosyltransferase/glycosyltransferase involved in cell wall biosynthesis
MSSPELSVIVVSWNSGEGLVGCLNAVRRSADQCAAAIEIVVVDNASGDGSASTAREAGADVVVENPLNVGFVAACLQGLALARAPWLMLANPDLAVEEGFVGAVLRAAASAPEDVASLVPDVRFAAAPSIVNSRGIAVDRVGIPAEADAGRRAEALVAPVEVFGASSSASVVRAEALRAVGGLEPAYFAYLEDVDVAWRLRKAGYRALIVPDAVALHEGSASLGQESWLKTYLVARNRRILFQLHGPKSLRVRVLRTVTELGHASVQAWSGAHTASVRGRAAALRVRPYERFLRESNRAIELSDEAPVRLVPRATLMETLHRKQTANVLMRRHERLRVLVDAANLKPGQGGIRTYTLGIIAALAREPDLELVVATSMPEVAELGPLEMVPLSPRTRDVAGRAIWRELNLARLARSVRADVLLTPVPELPIRRLSVPSVVVVHDVGPLVVPHFYDARKRLRTVTALRRACRLATAVVCVTEATLTDLRATGIAARHCEVIGEGPQLLHALDATGGVDGPFLLYVGSLDPRKNVETLVEAVRTCDPPLSAPLLVCGPVDGNIPSLLAGGDRRVRHLGFVNPERLAGLYRSAAALVLPSLYEGFGLPVLEAMVVGTPVVASGIPSLHEVAGRAALYVERPLDVAAWRDALRRICDDGALREHLGNRGRLAAERHSWPEVGRRFRDLLLRVASEGDSPVAVPLERPPRTAAER